MSTLILLNGCSSAGKTSIAKALQERAPRPFLSISVDTLVDMMPPTYWGFGAQAPEGYFEFIKGHNPYGPTVEIVPRRRDAQIYPLLADICKLLADAGNDLIIDDVILAKSDFERYQTLFAKHRFMSVGVMCPREVLQKRELERGDRIEGLANGQFDVVHKDILYDMIIESEKLSPTESAALILNALIFSETV